MMLKIYLIKTSILENGIDEKLDSLQAQVLYWELSMVMRKE
jgi:hypothetical protein